MDVFVHENILERSPDAVYVDRYKRFGPWMSKLFANGVEARGVERVPEDQRDSKNMWNKYVFCSLMTNFTLTFRSVC